MRRIAPWAAAIALICCGGCRNIAAPWSRTVGPASGAHPLREPEVRTARDAVSDAEMMPNQAHGGYVDPNGGP